MQPLKKRAEALADSVQAASERLKITAKASELARVDEQLASSEVWNNVERAQSLLKP